MHAKKAGLYVVQSDFEHAHAESEKAATIARQLSDAAREGAALAGMGLASLYAHRFDRSLEESEQAITIGRIIGSDGIVAAGQCFSGWVEAVTGQLDKARATYTEAYRRATAAASPFHQIISASHLSEIDNWQGSYGRSAPRARQARQRARETNLPFPHLLSLFSLGLPLTGKGDYDEALEVFSEGVQLAEKVGDEIFRNRLLNCIGWVYAECGHTERAIHFNRKGARFSHARGDPEVIANCELNLGDAHRAEGDVGLGREHFESVLGLARKPSTSDWMKWRYSQHLFAGLGEAWLASDDPAKAEDFCNQCLELAAQNGLEKVPGAWLASQGRGRQGATAMGGRRGMLEKISGLCQAGRQSDPALEDPSGAWPALP